MRAYGNVGAGTGGGLERGLDLPTEPVRRVRSERDEQWRRVRSPIPAASDEQAEVAARRAAERAAQAQAAKDAERAAQALRDRQRREERARTAQQAAEQQARRRSATLAEQQARRERMAHARQVRLQRLAEREAAGAEATRALAAAVAQRYAAGERRASIAADLGISLVRLDRLRRSSGLPQRRQRLDGAQVVALYEQLQSAEGVAQRLGTTASAVRYQLDKAGVDRRRSGDNGRRYPREVQTEAVARYAAGDSTVAICLDLDIGQTSLARWVKAAGVPRRPTGRRGRTPTTTTSSTVPTSEQEAS